MYNKGGQVTGAVNDFADRQLNTRRRNKRALEELGKKTYQEKTGSSYNTTKPQERKIDLALLLGDDLYSQIAPWLLRGGKALAAKAVPIIRDYVRKTGTWKRIADKIQDWTSIDLHDYNHPIFDDCSVDAGDIKQGFCEISSSNKNNQFKNQPAYSATGVNTRAVLAALNPSKYTERFPSLEEPVGLLCKQGQVSLTTNAAGNVAFVLQPYNIFTATTFAGIYNDVTLNLTTGVQTPVGT